MSRSVSVVTNEGGDQTLTYDGYGRVSRKELTRDGQTVLTVEYAYRNPSETSTTGQIASITIGTNGASRSYSYTYDANGNILSVSDGSNTTTYTYDKAGQLLRENNQAAGKTWVWEYDDAGNILNKKEYAYTTGNLGAVLDTVEYQYNNDNWGDLLTSYDGSAITYDEIGNPLNDGTWEYTWEHGRQLASMTDGTTTVDYEYNADGIRTRKTVITTSNHSHIFQTRVVAPTCTENGYTLHECSCGYSYQSTPVVSTGHTFVATEVEATCTAHGYTLMECECGYGYQEGTSGHTFTDTVVAPTAEDNGYTLHECACGYSYQDTPVAALGITNSSAGEAANTVVYDYIYNGSSLTYLTVTTTQFGQESTTETLYFGNGTVTYNGTVYYYVTNLQGDVVAILDADGNVKVEYTYDAWGKILSISGPMADTLGAVNPLTYRGYVYDAETDLYYLQSRYYDPAVERFINGDALVSTGQGMLGSNMFAYCGNGPVIRIDPSGLCYDNLCDLWRYIKEGIRSFIHRGHDCIRELGVDTAGIGAFLLRFEESEPGIYHAPTDCWQQFFGYNHSYDFFFDMGTSMLSDQFDFQHEGESYIIWVWKGDYINLGAGAELGIYYGGGPHWLVDTNLAMQMSMSLYYGGKEIISHSQNTWWITGFNSNVLNVQADQLSVRYTVYFSDSAMFNSFSKKWNGIDGWSCDPNNNSATLWF